MSDLSRFEFREDAIIALVNERENMRWQHSKSQEQVASYRIELATLRARVAELEAGLMPFAAAADISGWDNLSEDHLVHEYPSPMDFAGGSYRQISDFRRARALLAKAKPDDGEA